MREGRGAPGSPGAAIRTGDPLSSVGVERWAGGISAPRSDAAAYVGAAALSAAAVVATLALERTTGPTFFGLVLTAVATSVWLGGLGPGLAATSVTAFGMGLVLIEPVGRPWIGDGGDAARWVLFVLAALIITGLGHFMRSARERAEASERRLAILSSVHEALEPALGAEERLRRLATTLAPRACDWCAVCLDLGGAAGTEEPAGDAGGLRVASLGGCGPMPDEIARDAPMLLPTLDAGWAASLRRLMPSGPASLSPVSSAIVVPLEARGNRLGLMVLVTRGGRPRFGHDDLLLAEEIARRSALQIDNARLYEASRSMSAALARSDSLKTTMLRGVSHEFRTPLTGISAAAGALEHATGDDRREMLRIVVEETGRLERLVTNLLDLSRLDGGILRPRLDECSVAELVAGARAAAGRFLSPDDVEVALESGWPLVRVDPVLTERVLVNLLQNAKRHGRPPIRVSARRHSDSVEVTVADEGTGVPPELRGSLFEQFTGARTGGGLGLGLALSKRLAESQGADLALLDGSGGARFVLRLPCAGIPGNA